jgi:CheY-like chemotaxis protein
LEELPIILVVDDDPLIHGIVEPALAAGGFAPVIALSGEEAVTLLDESKGKYRALVTDIDMGRGKMSGWDVARHARQIDPAFPVIYMTGRTCRQMGFGGRSKQHSRDQAVRAGAACYRHFPASQCRPAGRASLVKAASAGGLFRFSSRSISRPRWFGRCILVNQLKTAFGLKPQLAIYLRRSIAGFGKRFSRPPMIGSIAAGSSSPPLPVRERSLSAGLSCWRCLGPSAATSGNWSN